MWKKKIETTLTFCILTNLNIPYLTTSFLENRFQNLWEQKTQTLVSVSITKVTSSNKNEVIRKFCFENYSNNKIPGRYWGAINISYYNRKDVELIPITPSEIKTLKKKLKKVSSENIKKNFYFREK